MKPSEVEIMMEIYAELKSESKFVRVLLNDPTVSNHTLMFLLVLVDFVIVTRTLLI